MGESIKVIYWDECHRIGLEEIDSQHKMLIDDFNIVVNAILGNNEREFTIQVFDSFLSETAMHFAIEEEAMVRYGFEDADIHAERHRHYIDRLRHLRTQVVAGDDVSQSLMTYFVSWVTHHVSVTDQKFGDFLKARGIVELSPPVQGVTPDADDFGVFYPGNPFGVAVPGV